MKKQTLLRAMMGQSGADFSSKSILLNGIDQGLKISDANFGSFTATKFAISAWVKFDVIAGANHGVIYQADGTGASNMSFGLVVSASGYIWLRINGGVAQLEASAEQMTTSNWYHLTAWYDSANTTADDRIRLWVNGVEPVTYSTRTNPSLNLAANNSTADVRIGNNDDNDLGTIWLDGFVDDVAFFDNVLPSASSIYNSGKPDDISAESGLHSYLNFETNVVADEILATDWTNLGTTATSTDAP